MKSVDVLDNRFCDQSSSAPIARAVWKDLDLESRPHSLLIDIDPLQGKRIFDLDVDGKVILRKPMSWDMLGYRFALILSILVSVLTGVKVSRSISACAETTVVEQDWREASLMALSNRILAASGEEPDFILHSDIERSSRWFLTLSTVDKPVHGFLLRWNANASPFLRGSRALSGNLMLRIKVLVWDAHCAPRPFYSYVNPENIKTIKMFGATHSILFVPLEKAAFETFVSRESDRLNSFLGFESFEIQDAGGGIGRANESYRSLQLFSNRDVQGEPPAVT